MAKQGPTPLFSLGHFVLVISVLRGGQSSALNKLEWKWSFSRANFLPHPKGSGPRGSLPLTALACCPSEEAQTMFREFPFPVLFLGVVSCDSRIWTQSPFPKRGKAFLFALCLLAVLCALSTNGGLPYPLLASPASWALRACHLWLRALIVHCGPSGLSSRTFIIVTTFLQGKHHLSENCVYFRRTCQT